jgi:drug/metabolite transporter (DMT)-like permease
MISKRVSVYLMICTAVALWGLSFIWTNQLLVYHIPVFTLIFTRLVLAAVVSCLLERSEKEFSP